MNDPKNSVTQQSLHEEFCHLLAIPILACAFNSDGVPVLRDPQYSHNTSQSTPDGASLKGSESASTPSTILTAIATLFVRGHEVFAVTDVTPTTIAAVSTAQETDDGIRPLPTSLFASIKNPREVDKFESSNICAIAPTGTAVNLKQADLERDDTFYRMIM